MTNDSSKPDRRSVLKGIAGGFAATTLAAVRPTAADDGLSEEFKRAARRYDDVDSARRAVAEHVGDLQSLLAAEGVIRGSGVFEIDSLVDSPATGEEMTFVTARTHEGQLTGEIHLSRDLGDRWLDVFVMPDLGWSYAAVHEDGSTTVYDPESDDGVVDVSSQCMTNSGCVAADVECGSCTMREAACCPDGSCYFTGNGIGDCGCQTGCFDSSCCALCGC